MQDIEDIRYQLSSDKVTVRKKGRQLCEDLIAGRSFLKVLDQRCTFQILNGVMDYEEAEIKQIQGKKDKDLALDVPQFVRNVFKFCIRYGQLSGYKLIETLNIFNFHFNILYDKSLSHGVRNLHKQMLCDVLEVKISHAFPFQFLKKDQHECGSIKILIYLKETMIDIKSCSDAINLKLLKTFCQCLFHDLEGEVVSVFASMLEWLHLMITPCLADIHIEQHVVVITTIMECYTYMLVFQGMNVINVMIPFVKTFLQFAAKLMHQNIFRSSCCEVIFQFLFIFGHVVHLENSALANALLGMDELQASLSNICIFFLSDEFITSLMQQSSRYSTTNKRANKDCYANLLEDSKLKLYLVTAMMTLTLYERYYGGEVMKIDDRQAAENFDLLLSQPVAKRQRLEHASTSTTIATLTKMTTRSVVDKLLLIENQRRQSSVAHHGVKNESIRRMEMMLSEGHLWYVIVIVKDYVWTEQSAAHLYQWFYQFAALFEHFVTHTQSSTQDDIQFFGVMLLNISTFLEKFQCNKLRIQDKDAINQTIAVVIDLMIKCEGKVKDWTSRSSQVDQILKQFCLQLLQSSMLSALIQSKLLQMLSTWNYCTELTSFSYNLSLLCLMASHGGQLPIIHMNTKKATLDVEVILPTGEDHSADNHRKLNFLERYLDLAFSQCSDIKTMNNSSGQELLQVVQRVSKSMQILIASLVFGNYSISSKVISSDHAKPWIQSVYEELLCAKGYNVLLETHPDIQSNHLFKPREDLVTSLHDQAFDTALYEEVFQSLEICREKLCESLKSQSLIQEMHDGHLMLLQIATMLCEAYLFMFQLSVLIKNTSTLSPRDLELSLYKIVEACLKLCQSKFSGKNIPLLTTLLKLMASCFSKFPEVHFTSVNQENQQCKENCKKLLNALNQLVSGKQVSIAKDNHPEALYRTNTSIDLTADWEMSGPGNATSQANSTANMNMLDRDNFRGGGVVHSSEHLLTQALMQTYIMVLSSRIDSLQSQNLSITSLLDANIARNSSVCLQLMEELNILGFFPAAVELMEASSWHIDRGILGFRSILLTILHALQQESLLPEEIVEKCLMFLFPSENDAVLNQMYANFWLNRYLRVECIFAILRRIQQFQGIKSQLPNIFVEAFGDHDVRVNYLASSKCTLLIRAFKNPTKVYRSLVQSSAIEIFSPATSQYDGEIVPDNPLKVAILALSIARMCYGGSIDLVKTALYDLIVLCSTRTSSFCNTRDNSNIPTSLSQSIASPKAPLSSSQRERSKHASSLFHGLQQAILYEFAEGLQYQHPAYFVLEYMRYLLFRWMHDFAEHSLQTNTESIESCSQEKLTALVHQSMELFPFYLLDENHTFGHDNKVRSPVNASIERSRQHMLSKYRSFVLTTVLQYPHSRLRWLYFQQYCNILQLPINDHELASLCQKILCQGKVYELTVYYSGKWYLQNKEQAPSKQCFQRHEYIQQFFKSTLNDNDIRRIVEEQIPSLTLELFRSLCCEPIDAVEAIAFDNVKEGGKWLEMIVKQLLTMSGGSQSISDLLDQINILAIFAQLNSLLNSMHSSRVIYFTGVEIHFILTHGLATHVYSRPSVIYAMMTCLRNMVVHGQDKMEIVIETFELIVDLLVAQIASKQASKRVIAAIASELVLLHYFLDDVALRLNNDKPTWTNDVSQFLQKFYRFNPSNLFRSVGENHADPAIATAQVEYATTLSLKFLTLFQRIAHQYSDSYGGKQYFAEEIFTLPRVFQDISGTASSTSKASASANNIDSSDAISSDVLLRQTTRCLERYMQSQISLSQMWMQILLLDDYISWNKLNIQFDDGVESKAWRETVPSLLLRCSEYIRTKEEMPLVEVVEGNIMRILGGIDPSTNLFQSKLICQGIHPFRSSDYNIQKLHIEIIRTLYSELWTSPRQFTLVSLVMANLRSSKYFDSLQTIVADYPSEYDQDNIKDILSYFKHKTDPLKVTSYDFIPSFHKDIAFEEDDPKMKEMSQRLVKYGREYAWDVVLWQTSTSPHYSFASWVCRLTYCLIDYLLPQLKSEEIAGRNDVQFTEYDKMTFILLAHNTTTCLHIPRIAAVLFPLVIMQITKLHSTTTKKGSSPSETLKKMSQYIQDYMLSESCIIPAIRELALNTLTLLLRQHVDDFTNQTTQTVSNNKVSSRSTAQIMNAQYHYHLPIDIQHVIKAAIISKNYPMALLYAELFAEHQQLKKFFNRDSIASSGELEICNALKYYLATIYKAMDDPDVIEGLDLSSDLYLQAIADENRGRWMEALSTYESIAQSSSTMETDAKQLSQLHQGMQDSLQALGATFTSSCVHHQTGNVTQRVVHAMDNARQHTTSLLSTWSIQAMPTNVATPSSSTPSGMMDEQQNWMKVAEDLLISQRHHELQQHIVVVERFALHHAIAGLQVDNVTQTMQHLTSLRGLHQVSCINQLQVVDTDNVLTTTDQLLHEISDHIQHAKTSPTQLAHPFFMLKTLTKLHKAPFVKVLRSVNVLFGETYQQEDQQFAHSISPLLYSLWTTIKVDIRQDGSQHPLTRMTHALTTHQMDIQESSLLWRKGFNDAALYKLRSLIPSLQALHQKFITKQYEAMSEKQIQKETCASLLSDALRMYGVWISKRGSLTPTEVLREFLQPSYDMEVPSYQKASSLYAMGMFCADMYQNLQKKITSSDWKKGSLVLKHREEDYDACLKIKQQQQQETAARSANHNNPSNIQEQKELTRHMNTLKKEIDMDKRERALVLESLNQFLIAAMRYFCDALQISSAFVTKLKPQQAASSSERLHMHFTEVDVIFRIVSLWLSNWEKEKVNMIMSEAIVSLPSYLFIPLTYQILSRLGSSMSSSMMLFTSSSSRSITPSLGSGLDFETVLQRLVTKMCQQHPYHTLPQLLALIHERSNTESNLFIGNTSSNRFQSATAVYQKLLQESQGTTAKISSDMKAILLHYIHLANTSTEKMQERRITKDIKFRDVQGRDKAFNDLINKGIQDGATYPVFTYNIPARPLADYQYILVKIVDLYPTFNITENGISRPKIITCLGSDGVAYKQLVKGGDDMRQDAVMQQVFANINTTLQKYDSTKRRNLHIRTYKVLPTTPQTGLLEWVENTSPFGLMLNGLHAKYTPYSWSTLQCREHLKNASDNMDKDKRFREICANFPPVFRYFFFEKVAHPFDWMSKRLAYTHSVATNSIAGYILGIGDRHAYNLLIDQQSGEVVHIDFGIVFDQGKGLTTPETVPFRLTREIVDGMGLHGCEGSFRRSCEEVLKILRENASHLLTILEVIIHDPLYKWSMSPVQAQLKQQKNQLVNEDIPPLIVAEVAPISAATTNLIRAASRRRSSHGAAGAAGGSGFELEPNRPPSALGGGNTGFQSIQDPTLEGGPSNDANNNGGEDNFNFSKDAAERTLMKIRNKLRGYEDPTNDALGVEGHVDLLINEAKNPSNLSKIFPGWAPWL